MRRELDGYRTAGRDRKLLLDFRKMPMLGDAVGPHAFVALDEQVIELGLAPRAAHAAERIGDDAVGLDQARLQQRNQRQQDAGGIASGGGHEHRFLDLRAIDLRQAVDRGFQQLRRRMVVRVELLVNSGALDAEIGAEIDDLAAGLQQGNGELRGDAVRQGQENDLRLLRQQFGVRFAEAQRLAPGRCANFGNTWARVCPAYWREVTAVSSTCGWDRSSRTNSSPE